MLGPDAEHEVSPRRAVLAHSRHAISAPSTPDRRSPGAAAARNGRKFIGGEPMKSPTNMRRRPIVDLLRRPELLDDAVVHHRDLVGHRHRLELVVGDVDRRGAEPIVQRPQLVAPSAREIRCRAHRAARPSGSAFGRRTMARPSATRWRSPPARPEPARRADGRCAGCCAASSTRARISARGIPWHFSGKPMFLRTFICG